MKKIVFSVTNIILYCILSYNSNAQALLDFETGVIFTGYNDVRIPGDQGTFFSLKNDLSPKTEFFYRVRLNYTIKSRHTFSALYAPLQTTSKGNLNKEVFFEGALFPTNTETKGTYKFNSYRLTYRYDIIQKPRFEFGLGFTAKIRDAKIALTAPGLQSEKTNVGFVPIINFRLFWKIDNQFGLLLDGDALAAPQGRAEDVLIAATYKLSDNFNVRAGYRILEGGANNDEVYNFALIHYASLGISYTFFQ